MSSFIAALVGIITALAGVVYGLFVKNSSLNKDNKNLNKTIEKNDEITELLTKETEYKKPPARKSNKIKLFSIILFYLIMSAGCSITTTPKLYIINKPADFKEFEYIYNKKDDTFIFKSDDFNEMFKQIQWAQDAIYKYEQQIKIYNRR